MFSFFSHYLTRGKTHPQNNLVDFSVVRQRIDAIKARFGMTEDGLIGQAICYYLLDVYYHDFNFNSKYWTSTQQQRLQQFAFAHFQIKDHAPQGSVGFTHVDFLHAKNFSAKFTKLINESLCIEITLVANGLILSNHDILKVLHRVENLLAQNPYNHTPRAVSYALENSFLGVPDSEKNTLQEMVFFATVETLYSEVLSGSAEKHFFSELISIRAALADLSPGLIQLIFAYAPLPVTTKQQNLIESTVRHKLDFTQSKITQTCFVESSPNGYFMVITGNIAYSPEIVATFNKIIPKSAYWKNALPHNEIYVSTMTLLHPTFTSQYKKIASTTESDYHMLKIQKILPLFFHSTTAALQSASSSRSSYNKKPSIF